MPNIKTSKYIKQKLTELKGDTKSNTVTVENFNTLLSTMDRSSRESIVVDKNKTIHQIDLTDIYEHSIQQYQNKNPSPEHMENFLR